MISKLFFFRLLLVIGMIAVAALFYADLPEQIPTHWNINGQPDDWGPKIWAAWMMPGISLILLFLLPFLAKIDPKAENYNSFSSTYEVLQTVLILFMTLMFSLQYYFTFHPHQQALMTPFMLSAVGVMFIVMGNYMGKVRQNFFVGLKTPWTLADPEVWQKSQRLTGWMFVFAGVIFLIQAWAQKYILATFIIVMVAIAFVPTIYSYVIYKRKRTA